MSSKSIYAFILGAVLAGCAVPAIGATIDPADVAFWQSIQDSKNAAEYQTYLSAFPNGVFADLARVRIQEYGGGGAPAARPGGVPPATTAAAPSAAAGAVVGKGIITPMPAAVDVGQKVKLVFTKFPTLGAFDQLAVVPAGTPDAASDTSHVLLVYMHQTDIEQGYTVGPFAPGAYEVRWLTSLYNNQNKVQIGARAQFSVNP